MLFTPITTVIVLGTKKYPLVIIPPIPMVTEATPGIGAPQTELAADEGVDTDVDLDVEVMDKDECAWDVDDIEENE